MNNCNHDSDNQYYHDVAIIKDDKYTQPSETMAEHAYSTSNNDRKEES